MISTVVPVLSLVASVFIPESPVYLIRKGNEDQAERSIQKLYGKEYDVSRKVIAIKDNLQTNKSKAAWNNTCDLFMHVNQRPEIYKPFFIVLLLISIQQLSGAHVLNRHVVLIFQKLFLAQDNKNIRTCNSTSLKAYSAAIVFAVVRLISSLTSSQLLLHFGRKTVFVGSLIFTCISNGLFAICVFFIEKKFFCSNGSSLIAYFALTFACTRVFSSQLGLQTIPNIMSGELYSSNVRAIMKGISKSISYALVMVSLTSYPFLSKELGVPGTFQVFTCILLFSLPLSLLYVPETKGLELEAIQNLFLK